MASSVAWLYDEKAHEATREQWRNFWSLYTEELLLRLGVRPQRIDRRALSSALGAELAALVVPRGVRGGLGGEELEAIGRWVEAGGTVICFATEGCEGLLDGRVALERDQPGGDEFAAAAVLEYVGRGRQWTRLERGEAVRSPVVSPLRVVEAAGAETLAFLAPTDGGPSLGAAVLLKRVGAGAVCYWAFDLAHCAWAVMQGRPVWFDRDGDGYLRTADAIVLREFDVHWPHIDLMVLVLREVLGAAGVPLVDVLPPVEGQPADCLVYIGGDEEGAAGTANWASRWMARQGLPYHVNIMPDAEGNFACRPEEVEEIRRRGHEVSLHFNFMDGFAHPSAFSEEDVRRQVAWFVQRFGFTPVTSVMHWVRWTGWAEPAQWMARCGLEGDNSRLHVAGLNVTDRLGYSFGTALPYRPWTDWHDGNRRVDLVLQPITAYEVGYRREDESNDYGELELALANAVRWRSMVELFYHSVNITWHPACRRAIEHAAGWLAERGVRAAVWGNDRLTRWWKAREEAEVVAERTGAGMKVVVECPWAEGCVVRVREPWVPAADGGRDGNWRLVVAAGGRSTIELHRRR